MRVARKCINPTFLRNSCTHSTHAHTHTHTDTLKQPINRMENPKGYKIRGCVLCSKQERLLTMKTNLENSLKPTQDQFVRLSGYRDL